MKNKENFCIAPGGTQGVFLETFRKSEELGL